MLVIALLLAISYAQTVAELEGDDSKAVAPVGFKEFSNPENLVGPRVKPWSPRDLDMELPLSLQGIGMTSLGETQVGGVLASFQKFKAACTAKAVMAAKKNMEARGKEIKDFVMNANKKSDFFHPLLQAGADVYQMLHDLWDAVVGLKDKIAKFKKITKDKEKKATADEIVMSYLKSGAHKLNLLRKALGFVGADGLMLAFGINVSWDEAFIFELGESVTAFFGVEKPKDLELKNAKLAFSLCAHANFGVGPKLKLTSTVSLTFSHNTPPGGEAGFGLAVDMGFALTAGWKWTLNWSFRNKKMEFVGLTVGLSAGGDVGVGLMGSYTATLFKYNTPRKNALQNVFKDAKNTKKEVTKRFKEHMNNKYGIDLNKPPRAETALNEPAKIPEDTVHTEEEVQKSAFTTDIIENVLGVVNPTMIECFAGLFFLVGLIFFSSQNAQRKDEYLLIGDDCDEI